MKLITLNMGDMRSVCSWLGITAGLATCRILRFSTDKRNTPCHHKSDEEWIMAGKVLRVCLQT